MGGGDRAVDIDSRVLFFPAFSLEIVFLRGGAKAEGCGEGT